MLRKYPSIVHAYALLIALCCANHAWASAHGSHRGKPAPRHTLTELERITQEERQSALYAHRSDAMAAASEIAQSAQLDIDWVQRTIGQAHRMESIIKAASPFANSAAKNWALYRTRFVEPQRIAAGVRFWQKNADTLTRAEQTTGVPASVIVGIVGVETIYGQNTGQYRVLDALSTLAFDFPTSHPRAEQRARYFRSELAAYLQLVSRSQISPTALRGSYAGAMGMPQFMPSSWLQYGKDFDGDGHIDLFHNNADVIGSVANYFVAFQWRPRTPTYYPVQLQSNSEQLSTLLKADIIPSFTPAAMQTLGVQLEPVAQQHPGLMALIQLQNGEAPPYYVAGTDNFYAITRYNWSSYYAMAVIELGQAIEQAMR